MNQTAEEVRALVNNGRNIREGRTPLALPVQVRRFYQQRDFKPIWIDKDGILLEAGDFLRVLKNAEAEGLPLQDYPVADIEQHLFGIIEGPSRLAQLELLLTDTFLLYSRNVRSGRFDPRTAGKDWYLPYNRFDATDLLTYAMEHCTMNEVLASLPPNHVEYRQLRTALQQYRTLAAQGGWPPLEPGETLRLGSRGARVALLRERLKLSGDYHEDVVDDPELYDHPLGQAVLRFQRRHGLTDDGNVGERTRAALNLPVEARIRQIEANMERWRWLPREMPERYIQVNMAGYELAVIEADVTVMRMRVIVGRDYRQTPVFTTHVTSLVLNPHWYVPRKIFREDILPALRRDPGRLQRLNMRVLNGGSEVDASTIDWSSVDGYRFPYTLRQEPGPGNALGRIKFLLPNDYGIFMHDTPDRHLFERPARAFSSGCIRLEYPLELASYLLDNPGRWNSATLEEAINQESQTSLTLPEPVPIYLTYWTAWLDEAGVLQLRDDIYDRDQRLLKLWGKSAT